MKLIFLLIVAALLVGAFVSGSESDRFTQKGYLKTAANDRIFTLTMADEATFEDFAEYAAQSAYTPGQMTAVYGYAGLDAQLPVDHVTSASTIFAANRIIGDGAFDRPTFVYMRGRNDAVDLVNCRETPEHSLCFTQ
jgi:hypothetical protein